MQMARPGLCTLLPRSDYLSFNGSSARGAPFPAFHLCRAYSENMVAVVGGQENLEESIEFVLWAAFLEFVLADQDPEVRNVNA